MAQNTSSDQNASVADLEAEIAVSRERLARNIDEIVHRAQPKTIVEQQKRQLRTTVKTKYASIMGTSQRESHERVGYADTTVTGDPKTDAKAKVEDLKAQAAGKAEELKVQAAGKAEELKAQAAAKAEELKTQAAAKADGIKGTAAAKADGIKSSATTKLPTRSEVKDESSGDADLLAQARVKSDQARLKLDELTHTEDGELRTERVATGLATLGAVLVGLGAAKRARS